MAFGWNKLWMLGICVCKDLFFFHEIHFLFCQHRGALHWHLRLFSSVFWQRWSVLTLNTSDILTFPIPMSFVESVVFQWLQNAVQIVTLLIICSCCGQERGRQRCQSNTGSSLRTFLKSFSWHEKVARKTQIGNTCLHWPVRLSRNPEIFRSKG